MRAIMTVLLTSVGDIGSRPKQSQVEKELSVWLLPPEGPVRTQIQEQINDLCADKEHLFEPHVTLLGGMRPPAKFEAEEWAQQVRARLEDRMRHKFEEGVKCQFQPKIRCCLNQDGKVQWNQSCVAVLNRHETLIKAIELAHAAFQDVDDSSCCSSSFDWTSTLKPPLNEPHLSLAYGHSSQQAQVPPDFCGVDIMLIWTCPATLGGVSSWEEVGRFALC